MQALKAKGRKIDLAKLSALAQRTLDTLRWLEDMYDALSAISVFDSGAQPKEIFYEVFGVLMRSAPGYIVYPEFGVVYLESGSVNIESPSGVVFYDDPDEDVAYTKLPPDELEKVLADVSHGLFTFLAFALEVVPDDEDYQRLRQEIAEKLEELAAVGATLNQEMLDMYRRIYEATKPKHLRVEVPEAPACDSGSFNATYVFPEPGTPGVKVVVEAGCSERDSTVYVSVVFPHRFGGNTETTVYIRVDALTKTADITIATNANSELMYNPRVDLDEYVKAIEEAGSKWLAYAVKALGDALEGARGQGVGSAIKMALGIIPSVQGVGT